MQQLTHLSPLGDLEIPNVGVVAPGETFEVDDHTAEQLLEQDELFQLAAPEGLDALTAKELRDILHDRGLPATGTKPALVARIKESDADAEARAAAEAEAAAGNTPATTEGDNK